MHGVGNGCFTARLDPAVGLVLKTKVYDKSGTFNNLAISSMSSSEFSGKKARLLAVLYVKLDSFKSKVTSRVEPPSSMFYLSSIILVTLSSLEVRYCFDAISRGVLSSNFTSVSAGKFSIINGRALASAFCTVGAAAVVILSFTYAVGSAPDDTSVGAFIGCLL